MGDGVQARAAGFGRPSLLPKGGLRCIFRFTVLRCAWSIELTPWFRLRTSTVAQRRRSKEAEGGVSYAR